MEVGPTIPGTVTPGWVVVATTTPVAGPTGAVALETGAAGALWIATTGGKSPTTTSLAVTFVPVAEPRAMGPVMTRPVGVNTLAPVAAPKSRVTLWPGVSVTRPDAAAGDTVKTRSPWLVSRVTV